MDKTEIIMYLNNRTRSMEIEYCQVVLYVGLTTTTLSRRLKMYLNDSSSIANHLKTHSIPKSKI